MSKVKGFSLIELAIVITIIGILAASVSVGQKLIAKSRLNAVVSEVAQLTGIVRSFALKYDYLPGDLQDAGDIWVTDCDATPANCDGDGDGIIDEWNDDEAMRSWQHLALAKFIPGVYTGIYGTSMEAGTNVYQSKYSDASAYMLYSNNRTSTGSFGEVYGKSGNLLHLGNSGANTYYEYAVFTGLEAQRIDLKMDDGDIDGGVVRSRRGIVTTSTECQTGTENTSPASYNMSSSVVACQMYFFTLEGIGS